MAAALQVARGHALRASDAMRHKAFGMSALVQRDDSTGHVFLLVLLAACLLVAMVILVILDVLDFGWICLRCFETCGGKMVIV